jgi:Domain of unknown function (DUF6378)
MEQVRLVEEKEEGWSGRKEILLAAMRAVADRGRKYGKPEQSFEKIATLWNGWLLIRKGGDLTGIDAAVMLGLMKVGRLANDPGNLDTWVDWAGYAACGGELVMRKEQG